MCRRETGMAEDEAPPPRQRVPGFPGLPWTGGTDDASNQIVQAEAVRRRNFIAATESGGSQVWLSPMGGPNTPPVLRESAKAAEPPPAGTIVAHAPSVPEAGAAPREVTW